MKNKKGLETEILVPIIITLLSLAVLFVVVGRIVGLFPVTITKEICHDSVAERATSIKGVNIGKIFVSIKCKTMYKCLSMGGECPEGYEKISVSNEEDIKREIADSMYDCWWMLGEGKIDFFSESGWKTLSGFGLAKSSCVVCSNIYFDDKVKEKVKDIDLIPYLAVTKVPNKGITYLDYFSDQKDLALPSDLKAEKLSTSQEYTIIFSGIKGGDFWGRLKTDAAILIGGSVIMGPSASVKAGRAIGGLVQATPGWWKAAWAIPALAQMGFEGYNKYIAYSYCNGETQGCFIQSIIPYNAEQLSKTCQNIESIP